MFFRKLVLKTYKDQVQMLCKWAKHRLTYMYIELATNTFVGLHVGYIATISLTK